MKILICSAKIPFTLPEALGSHTVTLKYDSGRFLLRYLTITQHNCKQQVSGNEGDISHISSHPSLLAFSVTADCSFNNSY